MISPANKLAAAVALGLLAGTAAAQTETQYVIEQLVVSVNATTDGSGNRVGQIKSGDHVEVLERQGEQTRVRTASGEEGWVRTSYLSSTPPLRDQLKARTDELEKLRQEKTKLESDLAGARKSLSAATAADAASSVAPSSTASDSSPSPSAAAETRPAQSPPPEVASTDAAPPSNPPLFSSEGMMPSRPSWLVALIASVATLGIGFALGWRMLDRRIRAKYGGLRIY